jgi:hypothetical protein
VAVLGASCELRLVPKELWPPRVACRSLHTRSTLARIKNEVAEAVFINRAGGEFEHSGRDYSGLTVNARAAVGYGLDPVCAVVSSTV